MTFTSLMGSTNNTTLITKERGDASLNFVNNSPYVKMDSSFAPPHGDYNHYVHPESLQKRKSNTNRLHSCQKVPGDNMLKPGGRTQSSKSVRKPPKAPRPIPDPKNLNTAFDGKSEEDLNISNPKHDSPDKIENSKIRQNSQPEMRPKKGVRKKKSSKFAHKMVKSQIQLEKVELDQNDELEVKPKKSIVNMVPIELDRENSEMMLDGSSSSEYDEQEYLNKRIESIEDLLSMLGVQVISGSESELHINIMKSNTHLTVPRFVFGEYCIKCKNKANITVQRLESIQNHNEQVPNLIGDASPMLGTNLDIENLRVADDMTTDRKATSRAGADLSPQREAAANNFANVFGQLEGMDGDSTLMAGFDEDDDEDTPPPLVKPQNLPVNQKKQKEESTDTDMTQEKKVDHDKTYGSMQNAKVTKIKTMSLKMQHEKMYDPSYEIKRLKEEVRLRDAEIQRLQFFMAGAGEDNSHYGHMHDFDEPMYHLAFMFASPLVRTCNAKTETLMLLDYQSEIKNIEKHLKSVKHEVRYKVDVATPTNFQSVIQEAPFALHFSGHGIRNTKEALGNEWYINKEKGDILLLEDDNGVAEYLFEKDLIKLIQLSKAAVELSNHYEVVFVSSCYSEFSAQIFLNSGARHVICIEENERISDRASLKFSQTFYEALFVQKYSVCKAFALAKEHVRTIFDNNEAMKYKLLLNDNIKAPGKKKKSEHKCFPLTKFKEGGLTKFEHIPIFDRVPSSVDNFIGRQKEMSEVLTLLGGKRLINILGPPGIGKTSFVKILASHIRDRKKFVDGIIYVSLRGCESAHMFLTRLSLDIQMHGKIDQEQLHELRKLSSKENSGDEDYGNEADQDKMRHFIISLLCDKEVLIVLDNCEDPLEDDGDLFVKQLDLLLDTCPMVKILLTSRKYINRLEHVEETPYHLYSLSPEASVRLLINKAPRQIVSSEIFDLFNFEIPNNHPIYQHFPLINPKDVTLSSHPLVLMLGGHPQAISLAAPMLESQSLVELFQQLLESNIMDALNKDSHSYASLRMSLDVSIKNLHKKDKQALDLFKFIGLLPAGINGQELTALWGDGTWKSHKEKLINASLLVYKQTERMFTLLPFMNTRALELLEEEGGKKKTLFHLKCCNFYKKYCQNCLFSIDDAETIFDLNQFVEKEANIWACIYRGINRKKDNDEYDEENEESKQMLAQSFKLANTQAFKQFTYKRKELAFNAAKGRLNAVKHTVEENEIREDENEEEADTQHVISHSHHNSVNKTESSDDGTPVSYNRLRKKESVSSKNLPRLKNKLELSSQNRVSTAPVKLLLNEEVEEMLVIYYVSTVIRLSKFSDGLKALNEYKKKKGLSKLAQAHMYKLLGVLTMMSEKRDFKKAKKYFTKSIEKFINLGCVRGNAISQLALLRCECEIEFNKQSNISELLKVVNEAEQSVLKLSKLDYPEIIQRAKIYVDCLKNKESGAGNFRRTLKTKTIRAKTFKSSGKEDTLLNSAVLQDEDIKLYVEVIEDCQSDSTFEIVTNEMHPKTPQTEYVSKKDYEEAKLRQNSDSDKDITEPRKFKSKRKRIGSIGSKPKLEPMKKREGSKSKKRRQVKRPLDLGRIPSIINNKE